MKHSFSLTSSFIIRRLIFDIQRIPDEFHFISVVLVSFLCEFCGKKIAILLSYLLSKNNHKEPREKEKRATELKINLDGFDFPLNMIKPSTSHLHVVTSSRK